MQLVQRYLLNSNVLLTADLAGNVTEYRALYQRRLNIYRGIDNKISFAVVNADQKPVSILNTYTVNFKMFDEKTRLVVEKAGTITETTGSGIVDCKKALSENNNDIEAAVKWLREKGILKAQKKQNRETNEGVVSFYNNSSNTEFTVCKIKCETDFVAKNNDFLDFAQKLSKAIHEKEDINEEEIKVDILIKADDL